MTLTPEQIKMLEAPLDPKNVKSAPQGKYGEYIDGYHSLSEANKIFGYGGWSYRITSLEQCSRVEAKDKDGNPQIRIGYRCTVRATAGGSEREGAAVGVGIGKPENEADVHESAVKEAETDALKRALRSFGNTFGLALYDKTKANVQAPPEEMFSDNQRDEISAMAQAAGVSLQAILKKASENLGRECGSLKDLPASEFSGISGMLQARIDKRQIEQAKEKENA